MAGALRLGALRLGTTAPLSVVRKSVLASDGVQIRQPWEEGQAGRVGDSVGGGVGGGEGRWCVKGCI